jgi:5-methylcytosine-specific restriction protein A
MSRSVPEWIGKTDDEKVPDRVKLRIWNRDEGHCHISGEKIYPGDDFELKHRVALILGGRHAESNLAFALTKYHRQKTADEMAIRAGNDARAKSHAGIKTAEKTGLEGRSPQQRRAAKDRRTAEAGKLALPPRRSMFADADPMLTLPAPSTARRSR